MPSEFIFTGRHGAPGVSRTQLRRAEWQRLARSVRMTSDEPADHGMYVKGHQLRRANDQVACDWTAAALWDLPLPAAIGLDLDAIPLSLAASSDEPRDRSTGVRGRRLTLPPSHIVEVNGIRLTTPARTWLDCSAFVSPPFSVAIADALLHRKLGDIAALESMLAWGRGRRGVVTARKALSLADARAESPRESWLRASLVAFGVPRPEVNIDIYDLDGCWLARVDLVWVDARLIVEYDGREFHTEAHATHDRARRQRLADAGWTVIVLRAEDLGDIPALAARVLAGLRGSSAR